MWIQESKHWPRVLFIGLSGSMCEVPRQHVSVVRAQTWSQVAWVQTPALLLAKQRTLHELLDTLCASVFSPCERRMIPPHRVAVFNDLICLKC